MKGTPPRQSNAVLMLRRLRAKRRSQPLTAPVAQNKSANTIARVWGGVGCGVVGWLRGGVEGEAVFLLGAADPMVGLLVASIRFDFHTIVHVLHGEFVS